MDFETVAYLRANSRAWRLLRADTAPLAIHVLGTIFIVDNVRTIAESDLVVHVSVVTGREHAGWDEFTSGLASAETIV